MGLAHRFGNRRENRPKVKTSHAGEATGRPRRCGAKRSRIHRKADVSLRNKHQLEVQVMFGEKNPKFLYNADYE